VVYGVLFLIISVYLSRAEARPTGRAVSRERLGDWDGPMAV
jgi:hypothetical protein